MKIVLLLGSALALFPALILAGPRFVGRPQNHRVQEVFDDVYPYAIPTSNPDVVISPFALNNLVNVSGVPPGAKVRDPVSEEIFLRP